MGLKDTINSTFFGQSADNRMAELTRNIENVRSNLRQLLIEKQRLECARSEFLTDSEVSGLVRLMKEAELSVYEGRNMVRLGAVIQHTGIRFHTMHGRYDIGNDNVVYVTRPLYSFKVDYMANATARIRNVTEGLRINGDFANTWARTAYSHPHVSDTHENAADFGNICYGSNGFTEILSNSPVTPQDYVEFLRRFHIWASHGNLNDMYDRNAYMEPNLSDKAKDFVAHSDDMFKMAQRYANGELDNGELAGRMRRAGFESTALDDVAFIQAYAAWMLKHAPALSSVVGHSMPRNSLIAAAKLDLVVYESLDFEGSIDKMHDELVGAPKALRQLIEKFGMGADDLKNELLRNFII